MPQVGGQYAYLRDVFHPLVGFLYGWVPLLVYWTGGMAAVTVTFARYLLELTGWHVGDWQIAVVTLLILTVVNCSVFAPEVLCKALLMVIKILAIALLVVAGAFLVRGHELMASPAGPAVSAACFSSFGAAMVPVVFAHGGWQTAASLPVS